MAQTDLILPVGPTSELEAVNVLIGSMGEAPFTALTIGTSADMDKAIGCLREANRALQSRGYNWNKEYAVQTVLAGDGTISIDPSVLRITKAYATPGATTLLTNAGNIAYPVMRGSKLYDQLNHTFTWTAAPLVDEIIMLPWDQLPEAARRVITLEAVMLFQSRGQKSEPVLGVSKENLRQAWITLEQQEDQDARHNALYGNVEALARLYGTMGMRRNRSPW